MSHRRRSRSPTAPARSRPIPPRAKRTGQNLLFFGAFVFLVNGIVGENGLIDSLQAGAEYRTLVETVRRLQEENRQLREEARRLRDDLGAIEEIARQDLGLIAPGEVVFYLNDGPPRAPDR